MAGFRRRSASSLPDSRLERGAQDRSLRIAWNGEPIGARARGQRELAIPANERFIVTQVTTAEEAGQRYIRVFFSDTLDPRQDFAGPCA